jgi:uncharacterized OB-fold protein
MAAPGIDAVLPPAGDVDATDFWAALADGTLLVAACGVCSHHWLPPLATCPRCGGRHVATTEAPASGTLYTWTVIHQAVDPVFRADAPYVVGLVELDDGTRLYGRVVGVAHDDLRDGLPLGVGVTEVDGQPIWFFGSES